MSFLTKKEETLVEFMMKGLKAGSVSGSVSGSGELYQHNITVRIEDTPKTYLKFSFFNNKPERYPEGTNL
ncbi:hypothetical protein FACS189472_11920 [Alphaproteobacteria bacterium]|nr:hypothetical protein FACS189472_11920 [Alphaproteobacteria bacterium]